MLLKGMGVSTKVTLSITTTAPTRRLVASSGMAQRGWITFSRYLSTGTARCTKAARCRVGSDSDRRGDRWPAIICNAGIMSRSPATIYATPGAIAARASRA